MRIFLIFIWILTFLVQGFSLKAQTQLTAPGENSGSKQVSPFGDLQWDDGQIQILEKLQKIPGLTYLNWHAGTNKVVFLSNEGPAEVTMLERIGTRKIAEFKKKDGTLDYQMIAGHLFAGESKEFLDSKGKKVFLPVHDSWFRFFPVNICGMEFEGSVASLCSEGAAVKFPEKTVAFGNKVVGTCIYRVTLESKSTIDRVRIGELKEALKKAYPSGEIKEDVPGASRSGSFSFEDNQKRTIKADWSVDLDGKSSTMIEYVGLYDPWGEFYREYKAGKEKPADGPDLKKAL